jgi:hypothetical protein
VISDQRIAELMGWSANPAHVTGVLGGGPDDLPARVRAVAQAAAEAALAQQAQRAAIAPTVEAAYEMGTKGGLASDAERLAFEAWMRGHCWALCARWNGTQYLSDYEQGGNIDPRAMRTRQLWAAWRDRAALAKAEDA